MELEESGRMSLLDVVSERIPGVFVTQRGVIGFGINNPAGTISIRGIGGSPNTQVLVTIDGVPQFMGLFGHPFPDTYLSKDARRVEVVRGPASVLYGTNAMGGVINIITRRETVEGFRFTGESSYGTFNSQEYSTGIGYRAGKFDILLSGGHNETAGHRPYSGFNVNNGYINGGYELSNNLNLRWSGNVNSFRTYDPGPASSPKIDNWVDVMRSTGGVSLGNKFGNVDGSVRLFYNYGDHDVFDGFHSIDRNLGAVLYENFHLRDGNVSTVGADYQHYGGTAVNNLSRVDFGRYFADELGVYAMVQQLVANTIMLNAGARLQHSSVFGNVVVPQGGIAWSVTPSTTIKASVSKGFRSPTIRELYLFPAPNPELQPERLWNYEIGLLHNISDHADFEITGFVAEGSNLILTEGNYPNLRLTNSGNFTHRGVESSGHYNPVDGLSLDGCYSYIDPGNQTYASPRHKFFLGCNYAHRRLSVNITLQKIAGLYGSDYHRNRLSNYTVAGARLAYQVTDYAGVFVSGQNLFNVSYQTVYDYPMPGRTVLAGVILRVGFQ